MFEGCVCFLFVLVSNYKVYCVRKVIEQNKTRIKQRSIQERWFVMFKMQ